MGIEHDRDVGLLRDVISLRPRRIIDREHGVLQFFFLGEFLELLFQILVVAQKDDEAPHVAGAILGGGSIDLLDQTGQGVADFACEDHGDRVAAVLSDEAQLFAGRLARDVQRVERRDLGAARLRARLQVVRSHGTARNQRGQQWRSYSNSVLHREMNLLIARNSRATDQHPTERR